MNATGKFAVRSAGSGKVVWRARGGSEAAGLAASCAVTFGVLFLSLQISHLKTPEVGLQKVREAFSPGDCILWCLVLCSYRSGGRAAEARRASRLPVPVSPRSGEGDTELCWPQCGHQGAQLFQQASRLLVRAEVLVRADGFLPSQKGILVLS